jgi:hypothetical protein
MQSRMGPASQARAALRVRAAGAGQAASAPSPIPTISGVLAGLAALCLGAVMAFCGAHFALRRA